MSNLTLTLGTHIPGELYISSRPVSSKHSFEASHHLFLQTKDVADEEWLEDRVGEVDVEDMGRVFDLVIRDAIVEGMSRRKRKKEKKIEKSKEDIEKKKGLYANRLDSSSVEGRCKIDRMRRIKARCCVYFFVCTEDPADTLTCPMFPVHQSLPGSLLPTLIYPQSLGDIPKREGVVVVHRETKEVFVRKTDGKVHTIKVKTDEQEELKTVDETELGKKSGKNEEEQAMAIRQIIGEKGYRGGLG
jgi:hypothetical protein